MAGDGCGPPLSSHKVLLCPEPCTCQQWVWVTDDYQNLRIGNGIFVSPAHIVVDKDCSATGRVGGGYFVSVVLHQPLRTGRIGHYGWGGRVGGTKQILQWLVTLRNVYFGHLHFDRFSMGYVYVCGGILVFTNITLMLVLLKLSFNYY